MLINKFIDYLPVSFAKNAAAFFRKSFSFSASASFCLSLRFSSINSSSLIASGVAWHSLRYQLLMDAVDTPYSEARLAMVRPSWILAITIFFFISVL